MKALLRLLYAAAMGVTLALLLFWEHLEYIYKREFALSNGRPACAGRGGVGVAGGGRRPPCAAKGDCLFL